METLTQVGISELGSGGRATGATLKQMLLQKHLPRVHDGFLVSAGNASQSRHAVTRHSKGELGSSRQIGCELCSNQGLAQSLQKPHKVNIIGPVLCIGKLRIILIKSRVTQLNMTELRFTLNLSDSQSRGLFPDRGLASHLNVSSLGNNSQEIRILQDHSM